MNARNDPPTGPLHPKSDRRVFLAGVLAGGVCGSAVMWGISRMGTKKPGDREAVRNDLPESKLPELDHSRYMRLAIEQAAKVPPLPFGAVIVHRATGKVLARGHNRSAESPIFHGEIDAIHRLAAKQAGIDWAPLVLYTTAEPCPMCQAAVSWAGIGAVVFGSSIPFLKELGWWQIDIRAEEVARRTPFRRTAVFGGVLEDECNRLFLKAPRLLYRQ
jgi:tRNA(Arg) A34 adenosine deaminase TadA